MDAAFVVQVLARYGDFAEDPIEVRRALLDFPGDAEAIDQQAFAAGSLKGKAVEHLIAGAVEAVGSVRVRPDLQGRVRCILVLHIGGEIPKAAKNRFPNVGDATGHGLSCLGRWIETFHE